MIIISDCILIVVAVKNEEYYLDKCLGSLILQNFPQEMYRITIVDGLSSDLTFQIALNWKKKYPQIINVYKNPFEWQAVGRNIGIKKEKNCNLITYIDGHCIADRDWLKNLYNTFIEKIDDNKYLAGIGSAIASPADESEIGKVIDLVFLTYLGAAGSSYKPIDSISEVRTAPYVLYNRSVLELVNFYDEEMKYGEDFVLNYKIRKAGYLLYVNPKARVYYYKRNSIRGFFVQMFNYGVTKAIIAKKYPWAISPFHYIPSFLLIVEAFLGIISIIYWDLRFFLIISLMAYILIILVYAIYFSASEKKLNYLIYVPLVYLAEHCGYSIGFITGLGKVGWK